MDRNQIEQLVSDVYAHGLNREAKGAEFTHWADLIEHGMSPAAFVHEVYNCREYQQKRRVGSIFAPGHYHSPVVDPDTVREYYDRETAMSADQIAGMDIDLARMRRLWLANLDFIKATPFTDGPSPANRYCFEGGPYPHGDGVTLRLMIGHHRPRRIVEIGSGYSSACALDAADHAALSDFHLTCIEPYPDRLKSLLRPGDDGRVTIIEQPVQAVSPQIVDALEPNDILLIDSTHVMKTGSDVHFEMFHLLPRLKPGVLVHVHDVAFPFEYPEKWVFEENYSWNEAYALRCFLMFNSAFRVLFWSSLYAHAYSSEIKAEFAPFLRNPGSAIWIERV
jgi:predicted O-methyltransferase YrrM